MEPSPRILGLIQYFNNLRAFTGVIDNPMNMSIVLDWQKHTHINLERWERECLFAMDRAFRRSYSEVLSYHVGRKPVKALVNAGRDYQKANQ